MAYRISAELTFWFLVMVVILTIVIVGLSRLVNPLYSSLRKKNGPAGSGNTPAIARDASYSCFWSGKARVTKFFKLLTKFMLDYKKRQVSGLVCLTPLTYLIVNGTLLVIIWQGYISIQGGLLSPRCPHCPHQLSLANLGGIG